MEFVFPKATNLRQPPEPPKQAPGATLDSRLSSLQERYRQHQEAMRNLTPSRRESTASRPSEAPVNNKHFIYDSVKKNRSKRFL